MDHCPECGSSNLPLPQEDGLDRYYVCGKCGNETQTTEVPEPELRRLVLNSIELARLKQHVEV